MESLILSLLDIENIYLKYEKKERLSHIPKRIGGWLAKVSTKYDLPFSKNHRYLAISVILDIIETYDMKPSQIKDLIQDVTFNKNNLDYWRTSELLDNFSNIEEKKGKRIQKDLGSYVPSILERIYRPGTGVMYQSKASIYDDGDYMKKSSSKKSSKKSSSKKSSSKKSSSKKSSSKK